MRRRLVASYIAIAAVILLGLEIPLGIVYGRHVREEASTGLQRDAGAIAALAAVGVQQRDLPVLDSLAAHYRTAAGQDVEVLAANGDILVPAVTEDGEVASGGAADRVRTVLAGATGAVSGLGDGDQLLAIAPIGVSATPAGAVIVTAPDEAVDHRVLEAWLALAVLAVAAIAAAGGLGLLVARSVTRPLTDLQLAASRLGEGNLGERARGSGPSETRTLANAFNDMASRLEELVAAQQAFVADASHQLRSPLTAVRLRLENVAADPSLTDSAEIDAVLGEIDRLSRVVDGLLLLARSEGERPARTTVDLDAIATERYNAWAALAEESGITLDLSSAGKPLTALWVPGHLEQVIDNLLANALEATPSGRGVHLVVQPDSGTPEVHVIDEGRGMSADERARAFDRLWRGSYNQSGSGLGLAIVKQLASASGARVELGVSPSGGVDAVVRSQRAGEMTPR